MKNKNLKDWLDKHKFKLIEKRFGVLVFENNLNEKVYVNGNDEIVDYDLLSKTKKDMFKNIREGCFKMVGK